MLCIDSFNYEIAGRVLFKDLGLTLKAGEHIVVVGDSGSGKSTLLKLIADCSHQQAVLPRVTLANGCSTTMVMQQGALLDHLSVVQNLELVARYSGSDATPSQLLENLNVDASLHHHAISQLSGGQKRRVAIARALVTRPDILLFDEPDAGLDIANLERLGATVKLLTQNRQTAAITVSHNPFFIARIASKVYRLREGSLQLIADWSEDGDGVVDFQQRQLQLQEQLGEISPQVNTTVGRDPKRLWIVAAWLRGMIATLKNLLHWPISLADEFKVAAYTYYLSFVSGALFFALVGLMLGSTVIAVVKMLTDTALTGLIALFITPDRILDMVGGAYVLYLGPAIGGMLFAARSGSIVCNWLGEMVRGKQVQALQYLQVPPGQYLAAPSAVAMFFAAFTTILWFAAALWVGGLLAANLLFGIADPAVTLQISRFELEQSLFWQKALIYSALVSLTIISLGMASKSTAHELNMYTTKAIIYSTLSISLAELIIILS